MLNEMKNVFKNVTDNLDLNLDLSYWEKVSDRNSKDAVLIKECGELVKPNAIDYKQVSGKDTGCLDGVAIVSNGIKSLNVYMFCKHIKDEEHQDLIMNEVKTEINAISRNKDKNCVFMFLLEGEGFVCNNDLKNDIEINGKSVLLPINGNESETKEMVKQVFLNYFSN